MFFYVCLFNIILSNGWEMGWKGIKSIVYFIFVILCFTILNDIDDLKSSQYIK